jgi:hypothetical protein
VFLGWGLHSIPHNQPPKFKENISDEKMEVVKNQWVERK